MPKKITIQEKAERVFNHFFAIDNKEFRAKKIQEIRDWLNDGEWLTLKEAIKLWREYDADEIALFRGAPPTEEYLQ